MRSVFPSRFPKPATSLNSIVTRYPAGSSGPAPDMSEFDAHMAQRNEEIKREFERRQVKKANLMIEGLVEKEKKAQDAEEKTRASKLCARG